MDEQDEHGASHRHCPACGADVPDGSRFCGVCGADTLAAQASADASADATPGDTASDMASDMAGGAPDETPDEARMADAPADTADHTNEKLCAWCGAYSPLDAVRCVACNAVFPTPEGDQALEHAAQERIKAMEGDLKRRRKGGWWPFGSR
ncbi:MAG: zinc ribbon domain-containing protein [Chloroflexota bacterium]|nr:zinc ribbon domain-containing protein [Chloroflexota bacterium]